MARSGNCHGEIHKVACSGEGCELSLKAMPFLHGLLEGTPDDGVLFRRWVMGYQDAKDIIDESFVENDML